MLNQPIHNCCMISRRRDEPMMGSVKPVEIWLLLQHEGAMGMHALAESDIPESVKTRLNEIVNSRPGLRALLIKSQAADSDSGMKFILANGREIDPYYVQYELDAYEDLLDLDLKATIENGSTQGGEIAHEPFYLVCTNGRRDPCCAQNGLPLFNALQDIAADHVWQSSHVGGHRFAANVLAFPHGVYYGRVNLDEAQDLLDCGENSDLLIERYRGRACYEQHVQAAEAHLRRETGQLGLEDFHFWSAEQQDEGWWEVVFMEARTGSMHELGIEVQRSGTVDFVSCRDDKQSPTVSYRLYDHTVQKHD